MLDKQKTRPTPRILFFGMQCAFSAPALMELLDQQIDVCAIVVPASPVLPGADPLPITLHKPTRTHLILPMVKTVLPPSLFQIAATHHIPVWEVRHLADPRTINVLSTYQADLICVACFSLWIPRSVLDLSPLGSINLHPSLLPSNRGPVPLFWVFRDGLDVTGVTVHYMEEKMDAGDVLAQALIPVPDGIRYEELEFICAKQGGTLLARVVWDVYGQRALRVPQNELKSSYHSFPSTEDFVVTPETWNARHLYNFLRGVADWHHVIEMRLPEQSIFVTDAFSYSLEGEDTADDVLSTYECISSKSISESGQEREPEMYDYFLPQEASIVSVEALIPCRDGQVRVLVSSQ